MSTVSSMYILGVENVEIKATVVDEVCWAVICINGRETTINLNFENKKALDAFAKKNNVTIEGEGNE